MRDRSPAAVKAARFLRTAKRLGLYREDEHTRIGREKMARCLFVSIFSSKDIGALTVSRFRGGPRLRPHFGTAAFQLHSPCTNFGRTVPAP